MISSAFIMLCILVQNQPSSRDFQSRILNSILVRNDKLSRWGIMTDESCSFCHSTPESIMHLLRECEISKRLWSDVSEYVYDNSGLRINMSDADVLLVAVGARDTELLNLIHIIVKQNIYACRCNKINPTMTSTKVKNKTYPARICNHIHYKVWDEITYPFLNLNGPTVEA